MKMVKDKKLVVGADFAGYPLKEARRRAPASAKGWEIEDVGVKSTRAITTPRTCSIASACAWARRSPRASTSARWSFCGTGMGIHIAASKCPHVHAGVVESVPAALRAITGNGVNVLAMGAFYVAPQMGCDIANAYLNAEPGQRLRVVAELLRVPQAGR